MTTLSKIVVPLDGGPEHQTAIAVAAQLAARAGARVELLTVASPGLVDYDEAELEEIAGEAEERFGEEMDTRTLTDAGSIAGQLVTAAEDPGTLLCLSSTARAAIVEAVTGSVSADVIRRAGVPVVVVGPECESTWRGRILAIAVDTTPPSEAIVEPAVELAARLGLVPRLYQVAPEGSDGPIVTGDVMDTVYVARLAREIGREGAPVDFEVLHSAHAGDALVELSREEDVAMIAMTTHGRRPLRRLATPSLLQRVLRHAACPVLVRARSED